MKYDKEEVRANAPMPAVLDALGLEVAKMGAKWRGSDCPACGPADTPNLKLISDENSAHCYVCGKRFDCFAAVQAMLRCDFAAALMWLAERFHCVETVREQPTSWPGSLEPERAVPPELVRAWDQAARKSPAGHAYLATRGLKPSDVVRYTASGDLLAPMRSIETGKITGAQTRYLSPGKGERRQNTLRGSVVRGSVFGDAQLLERGAKIVLCEGLIDYLTGLELFYRRGELVLGLPGVSNARHAIRLLLASEPYDITLCMDADAAGQAAVEACREEAAKTDTPVSVFALPDGCKDLNEAFCEEYLTTNEER